MLIDPNQIAHVAHPMVEMAYLRKELMKNGREGRDNVLVVKLRNAGYFGTPKERQDIFIDFLANLGSIRKEFEKTGKFKRIDIQGH